MNLFTQLGLNEMAQWAVKIIAAVGGAFIGWFLTDPLARISFRVAFQRPIPGWTLPWAKLSGGTLLAVIAFLVVSFGGGPGGLGFGPGLGGSPGMGSGEGGAGKDAVAHDDGKKADDANSPDKNKAKLPDMGKETIVRKTVAIEVLGGENYPGDNRWYVIRPAGKPLTLEEVEVYFKENSNKLELRLVKTDESALFGPIDDLTALAGRYHIPTLNVDEGPKKHP
jgi:hypothetical protein